MKHDDNKTPSSEEESLRFDRSDFGDQEVQDIHDQLQREKSEPREGFAVPPLIIVFMCMVLCLWGGYELANSSAGFRWDAYDPNASAEQEQTVTEFDPIASGKRVYNNCVACHQANGQGIPGVYPPLANSDWVNKSPEILVRIVNNGLSGEIVVNGETYNNAMTGFSNLSDRDIASVLSYIRNSWGNDYSMIEESQVATIRENIGSRSSPYSPAELLEMFPE